MGFFDWLLSIRKKPLPERRRFVAVFSIAITGVITLTWLLLSVSFGPLKLGGVRAEKSVASPAHFELPQFPELPSIESLQEGMLKAL